MGLKNTLRGKLNVGDNKYLTQQQKMATILQTNKADNYCTISVITRDGIEKVFYKVPVLYSVSKEGTVTWFPTTGEKVMVTENNKSFTITGPADFKLNDSVTYDSYSYGVDDSTGYTWG